MALFDPASLAPDHLLPAFLASVREVGYARLHDAIAPGDAARLRAYISAELERVLRSSPRADAQRRLGTIRAPTARYDLALDPRAREVRAACAALLARAAALGAALVRDDGDGDDDEPRLVEFGALVSDRGAPAQPWHSDTTAARGGCRLLTAFVALDDVSRARGPTELLPRTHAAEFGRRVAARGGAMPAAPPDQVRAGFARVGDACVMDSRLFHRGGANSEGRRHVLYFSFVGERAAERLGMPKDTTFTLLESLEGTRLRDLVCDDGERDDARAGGSSPATSRVAAH